MKIMEGLGDGRASKGSRSTPCMQTNRPDVPCYKPSRPDDSGDAPNLDGTITDDQWRSQNFCEAWAKLSQVSNLKIKGYQGYSAKADIRSATSLPIVTLGKLYSVYPLQFHRVPSLKYSAKTLPSVNMSYKAESTFRTILGKDGSTKGWRVSLMFTKCRLRQSVHRFAEYLLHDTRRR